MVVIVARSIVVVASWFKSCSLVIRRFDKRWFSWRGGHVVGIILIHSWDLNGIRNHSWNLVRYLWLGYKICISNLIAVAIRESQEAWLIRSKFVDSGNDRLWHWDDSPGTSCDDTACSK